MEKMDGKKIVLMMLAAMLMLPMVAPVAAGWHGGKALVLYKDAQGGWVQYDYKTSPNWSEFRANFAEEGWSVDFTRHVNLAQLQNYDALFVLTPVEDIPDAEACAIITWVEDYHGQLVITQNDNMTYANEITEGWGIRWISPGYNQWEIDTVATDPITEGITHVEGVTAQEMNVSSPAVEIGWDTNAGNYNISPRRCYLAKVYPTTGADPGVVVAIGEEFMWQNPRFFDKWDNERLMDNILAYFWKYCSIPEFSSVALPAIAMFGLIFLISRRSRHSKGNS